MLPTTILPANNSVYISDPNGLAVLGQSPYGVHGIQDWMSQTPYQQKYLFTDELAIQVHTQFDATNPSEPNLFICDYYNPNTGDYRLIGASAYNTLIGSSINLNIKPYLKGYQNIANNNYQAPFTGAIVPLLTSMWAFSFSDLGINTRGTYYLLLVNNSTVPTSQTFLFSEPVYITDSLPNTLLFQSQYNTNKGDNINTVVTGWWNDWTINTQTYTPLFLLRCEGYIIDLDPKVVMAGYLQQLWQQVQTFAKQVRMKTLKVGELSNGIPPYMLEMVTAQILSDTYWIGQYSYIGYNTSNSTGLMDMWKSKRPNDAYPLLYANTVLMERYQSQGAIVTPPPPIPMRYFAPTYFSDGFA